MDGEHRRNHGDVWSERTRDHADPDENAAQETEIIVGYLTAQKADQET